MLVEAVLRSLYRWFLLMFGIVTFTAMLQIIFWINSIRMYGGL